MKPVGLGSNYDADPTAIIGFLYRHDSRPPEIGEGCVIRAYTILYADTTLGCKVKTGHHVTIREQTRIGDNVIIGTSTIIDGQVTIGSFVKIESRVYIPTHTAIGSHVFIGPGVVMTNDKYPLRLRAEYEPKGPILEDGVTIGANATILPGIRICEGAMVGAGAVVTRDVPAWHLALGNPARLQPLPDRLREQNRAKRW